MNEHDFLSYLHECDTLYYSYYIKKIPDYLYDTLIEVYETIYKKDYPRKKGIVFYPQRTIQKQTFGNFVPPETNIRIQDNVDGVLVGVWYVKTNSNILYTIFYGKKVVSGTEAELFLQHLNITKDPFCVSNNSSTEIFVLGIVPIPILDILQAIIYEENNIVHTLDYAIKKNTKPFMFFCISIMFDGNDETICYDPTVLKSHHFLVPYTMYSDVTKANKNLLSYCNYARYGDAYYNIRGLIIYKEIYVQKEPFYTYNNQKNTEPVVVKEVCWNCDKRTGILRPTIYYTTSDSIDTTISSCISSAEKIITVQIRKGSLLLVEKTIGKEMIRRPLNHKIMLDNTVYILANLNPVNNKDIYPDKTIYGDYEWNKRRNNFICKKSGTEMLEKKIVDFFKIFGIKNYQFLIEAGLVKKNIYTSVTDIFYYNPMQLYYALDKVDMYKLFGLWEHIKRIFLKAPLYALMYISGIFGLSKNQLHDIIYYYPDFFSSLEKSTTIIKTKTIHKNYSIAFDKKEAFFHFLSIYIPKLLFLNDNTFTVPMQLSLEQQTVCFTGFRSTRRENDIHLLKGTYSKDINANTTLLVNALPKDASNRKLRYAKKNNIMIVSTYFFNLYYPCYV
jgi:hypothetical protein